MVCWKPRTRKKLKRHLRQLKQYTKTKEHKNNIVSEKLQESTPTYNVFNWMLVSLYGSIIVINKRKNLNIMNLNPMRLYLAC